MYSHSSSWQQDHNHDHGQQKEGDQEDHQQVTMNQLSIPSEPLGIPAYDPLLNFIANYQDHHSNKNHQDEMNDETELYWPNAFVNSSATSSATTSSTAITKASPLHQQGSTCSNTSNTTGEATASATTTTTTSSGTAAGSPSASALTVSSTLSLLLLQNQQASLSSAALSLPTLLVGTNDSSTARALLHATTIRRVQIPSDFDVLCGRGKPIQEHMGNVLLHQLVDMHMTRYILFPRDQKKDLAAELVSALKANGVRFLKRDRSVSGVSWIEIDNLAAIEKVAHCFRSRRS